MAKKTVFGQMLVNYRFLKQEAIKKARNSLWDRNKLSNPAQRDNYEIRESTVAGRDGSSVTKLELWQRIDSERVKISSSVSAEVLKDDEKDEGSWL